MSYATYRTANRRLHLLQALSVSSMYRCNALLLRAYADKVGHMVSSDVLAADLAWLAEGELLVLDGRGDSAVATITARGLDVATGRAEHPGVDKPGPV